MTAISFIAPYAPQPIAPAGADLNFAATQLTLPVSDTSKSSDAGLASDQSGQGTGNGTGTGGAQLAALLNRTRDEQAIDRATPESVVEAQSTSDPATEYLARQAQAKADAEAARAEQASQEARDRAARAELEAAQEAEPEFKPPNPLPTAPILLDDDS